MKIVFIVLAIILISGETAGTSQTRPSPNYSGTQGGKPKGSSSSSSSGNPGSGRPVSTISASGGSNVSIRPSVDYSGTRGGFNSGVASTSGTGTGSVTTSADYSGTRGGFNSGVASTSGTGTGSVTTSADYSGTRGGFNSGVASTSGTGTGSVTTSPNYSGTRGGQPYTPSPQSNPSQPIIHTTNYNIDPQQAHLDTNNQYAGGDMCHFQNGKCSGSCHPSGMSSCSGTLGNCKCITSNLRSRPSIRSQ